MLVLFLPSLLAFLLMGLVITGEAWRGGRRWNGDGSEIGTEEETEGEVDDDY